MTLIADATLAKGIRCPECDAYPGRACSSSDRQRLPLEETHQVRLDLAVPGTTSKSGVRDA